MCGISGIMLKKGSIDTNTVKLFLIFNTTRGSDAFGIYNEGKIWKSHGYEKGLNAGDASIMLHHYVFPQFKGNFIMLHNRQKSVGINSKENTHPFKYRKDDGDVYVFTHNGTIKNIDELTEKYNVPKDALAGTTDSEALGYILVHHGFEVLSEYRGGAAISLYNQTKKELYLFKGFSKHDSTVASEERPLHYAITKKGFYYSSLKNTVESTLNIADCAESCANNILYKIVDAEIVDQTFYDRSAIEYKYTTYTTSGYDDAYGYNSRQPKYFENNKGSARSGGTATSMNLCSYTRELSPQNQCNGALYYHAGRIYHNGHGINGIYKVNSVGQVYSINDVIINKDLESFDLIEVKGLHGYWIRDEYFTKESREINYGQFMILYPDSVGEHDAFTSTRLVDIVHQDHLLILKRMVNNSVKEYALYRNKIKPFIPVLPKFGYYMYTNHNNGSITTVPTNKNVTV